MSVGIGVGPEPVVSGLPGRVIGRPVRGWWNVWVARGAAAGATIVTAGSEVCPGASGSPEKHFTVGWP